jgi:xylulokinase
MMDASRTPTILTIDAGTSALKAALYDERGGLLGVVARPHGYQQPRPGWAEADPRAWWAGLADALAELRAQGFDLAAVRILGVTGQMHAPVLLDERGEPLEPTILWLDSRAAAETAWLQQELGLPPHQLNSAYTLPKLLWLARHRPGVLARTRTLLWPKDYIRHRLTGRALTDVTEAAGAALLDWETRTWALDRLALTGLDAGVLPELASADADAGPLRPAVAAELGLPPDARVIVGAGDVLALIGGAPPQPGRLTCSLGSSAMLSSPLAPEQTLDDPASRLYVYPFLPYRLLNGVLSTGGAALIWARRALYDEGQEMAALVDAALATPPGADGLLFLPFLVGARSPYWSDDLRGGFYGLTLSHGRAHMVRAALEGVAYSLRHALEIAAELGAPMDEIALAGGGASVPGWPQIMADVCQRPVVIYAGQETVTRPLYAYCAAALGSAPSFEAALAGAFTEEPQYFAPNPDLAPVYAANFNRYRSLADFVAGDDFK